MSQQIQVHRRTYRPFQIGISDILALMLIVAILASTSHIQPSLLHAFFMIIALYLIKIRIAYLRTYPVVAIMLYLITLFAISPYLYYCVIDDWDEPFVLPQANWIGGPIAVFTIPTISFIYDLFMKQPPRLWVFIVRSVIEIVVIIPIWVILWVNFEFFVLDWILV